MSNSNRKGLFVTGTDTGVGKTIVTAGLVSLARRRGLRALGVKPVETGCALRSGSLYPEDGAFLAAASEKAITLDEVTPFRFSLPASPARAAAMEGRKLTVSDLVEHVIALAEDSDLLVVEGAGGLMVPIQENLMMIDLVERLGYPVLLVGRTRLGTVNHTLLSVSALRVRNIQIAGIVLSCSFADIGPEEEYTPRDIARLVGDIPVLLLPFLNAEDSKDPDHIADVMESRWPTELILKLILGT
jgi:dethiobiotin synthetase